MNKEILTAFFRHPKRGLIVITGTFVIILLIVWPLTDEYYDVIENQESVRGQIAMSELNISTTSMLKRKLAGFENDLSKLETQMVVETSVDGFRKQIVETVRQVNCRVKKLHVQTPSARRWYKFDHPIKPVSTKDRGPATPFDLTSTLVSLSVTGRIENLKRFLQLINENDKFIHAQRFALRSNGANRNELVMDLDLQLFGFQKTELNKK